MNLGWPEVPIGDAAIPVNRLEQPSPGMIYRQVGVRLWGEGAYERAPVDGRDTQYKTLNRTEEGDIIVNKIWARNGSVSVITKNLAGCYVSAEFPLFKPILTKLDPKWFYWITKTRWFWSYCDFQSQGTSGKNRIRPEKFLAIKIPLPPLTEQQRILAKIENLAAKIEETRDLRRQSDVDLSAFLASSYDAVFTENTSWLIKRVSDFCERPQYGYTASATFDPVGPKMLRITDIQNGYVNWSTVPYCDCQEPNQYILKEEDILFARTGATTGKSFLIRECPQAVFASYLIRLRVQHSVIPEYLYAFFQTPNYWSQIADNKKGTGQPNCNGQKLANIKVPIPPMEEQRQIVAYLDSLQAKAKRIRELQKQTAAELDVVLPSILDKAFKGEL